MRVQLQAPPHPRRGPLRSNARLTKSGITALLVSMFMVQVASFIVVLPILGTPNKTRPTQFTAPREDPSKIQFTYLIYAGAFMVLMSLLFPYFFNFIHKQRKKKHHLYSRVRHTEADYFFND